MGSNNVVWVNSAVMSRFVVKVLYERTGYDNDFIEEVAGKWCV